MPYPQQHHSSSTFTPDSLLDNYPPDHLLLLNPKLSTNPNPRRTLSSIDTPGASRNSSLQKVWAEDYYNIDYSSEGEREYTDQGVREKAGGQHSSEAQPFPGSIDFEQENDHEPSPARPARTHQRSLTALLPFRSPTRTSSKSPERKSPQESPRHDLHEFIPTLTGDKEGVIKVVDKSKGIASWFTGSSALVPLGISVAEDTDMALTGDNPEGLKKRPTLSTNESSSSVNTTSVKKASAGWGSFFSSPKTPSKPAATIQLPADLNDDEFLTLDIKSALFPAGPPSPQDPFSPAAFKNLQQQAEGLLQKLQTAYKLRTQSLHDLRSEKETLAEELEEAETKNNLLKANLTHVADQIAERDAMIAELMTELTKEKQARALEKEARELSIREVKSPIQAIQAIRRDPTKRASTSDLSIDTTNEDLGISSARHRKRQSGLTDNTDYTEGDSDGESAHDRDSTFSRARSPVNSMAGTVDSTPEIMQAGFGKMVPNPTHTSGFAKRPPMVQQKSMFQKALGRITNGSEGSDETVIARTPQKDQDRYDGVGMGETGCSNCRGKDSSVAWDTVGMMRAENKGLKDRLYEMDRAVDEASDMCTGLFGYDPLQERSGDGSYPAAKCWDRG